MMRTLATAAGALLMLTITASAGETEGQIKAIDKDQLTITLSDGKNYKLPGEFDVDSLKESMDVVLAYDEVGGQNLITDMQLPQ